MATVAFAHWPGSEPLVRRLATHCTRLVRVLGKFMLLDDYFSHTDMPGRLSKFEADEYRTPYLKQAIIRRRADPISRLVRAHRAQAVRAVTETLKALHDFISGKTAASPAEPTDCVSDNEGSSPPASVENLLASAVSSFAEFCRGARRPMPASCWSIR